MFFDPGGRRHLLVTVPQVVSVYFMTYLPFFHPLLLLPPSPPPQVKSCGGESYQLSHLSLLLRRMVFLMTPEHQVRQQHGENVCGVVCV